MVWSGLGKSSASGYIQILDLRTDNEVEENGKILFRTIFKCVKISPDFASHLKTLLLLLLGIFLCKKHVKTKQ